MPARVPVQAQSRLGTIELKVMRLVRLFASIELPAGSFIPLLCEAFDDPLHRLAALSPVLKELQENG